MTRHSLSWASLGAVLVACNPGTSATEPVAGPSASTELASTGPSSGDPESSTTGTPSESSGSAGPTCGDLVVEGAEECEGSTGCWGCIRDRILFVTSDSFPGSFLSFGDLSYWCNHYADIAGLLHAHQSRFRPLLAVGGASAASLLNPSPGRYVLLTGDVVAETWEALMGGRLLHAPNVDEFGRVRQVEVWTGSRSDTSPGDTCEGWTTDGVAPRGTWGHSGRTDMQWLSWADPSINPTTCAASFALYCIEA